MLHGLLVSFGFLILLPAGALIGRYGRAFTNKWFKYHWMTNLGIAGPVITTGALLGPVIVYNKDRYRTHFINAHEVRRSIVSAVRRFIYTVFYAYDPLTGTTIERNPRHSELRAVFVRSEVVC